MLLAVLNVQFECQGSLTEVTDIWFEWNLFKRFDSSFLGIILLNSWRNIFISNLFRWSSLDLMSLVVIRLIICLFTTSPSEMPSVNEYREEGHCRMDEHISLEEEKKQRICFFFSSNSIDLLSCLFFDMNNKPIKIFYPSIDQPHLF